MSVKLHEKGLIKMTDSEAKRIFGNNLREQMKKRGITPQELSMITGIRYSVINQYMNGVSFPAFQGVISLVTVLGCHYDELFTFYDHID